MKSILRLGILGLTTLVMALFSVSLLAHQVTHKGTAVALKAAKYAQPSGGSREVHELELTVVDPKTKKSGNRVFTITDKTRVLRAGKSIKVAAAAVQKGEEIAVVVDHDKPGDEAIEVLLGAGK